MHLLNHDQRQITAMQCTCVVIIVGSANVNKLNNFFWNIHVCWCYNVNCILLIDIIVAVNRIHIHVDAVFAAIFV